jgi:hypothetical protein
MPRWQFTLLDLLLLAASPALGWFVLSPVIDRSRGDMLTGLFVLAFGLACTGPLLVVAENFRRWPRWNFGVSETLWAVQAVVAAALLVTLYLQIDGWYFVAIFAQMALGLAAPAIAAYFTFSSAEHLATWLSWLAAGTSASLAALFVYAFLLM